MHFLFCVSQPRWTCSSGLEGKTETARKIPSETLRSICTNWWRLKYLAKVRVLQRDTQELLAMRMRELNESSTISQAESPSALILLWVEVSDQTLEKQQQNDAKCFTNYLAVQKTPLLTHLGQQGSERENLYQKQEMTPVDSKRGLSVQKYEQINQAEQNTPSVAHAWQIIE